MIPSAHVSHRTAGRLRLKLPSLRGSPEQLDSVRGGLAALEGIERIEANSVTGSLLCFHRGVALERVAQYGQANNLFALAVESPRSAGFQRRVSEKFRGANEQLTSFTSGEVDMAGLAFIVLVGAGIYEISRGNFTAPAWYTAFWYALNILLKSNKGGELA